jgi:ATP-dependent DNA ligase
VKREWTADVVITGFEMAKEESKKKSGVVSKTKFAGMVGAVSISQWKYNEHGGYTLQVSKPGRGVSGMDDATRADITAHPKKYLGKVLRIKHNGREPTGFFRHPRWDGLRDDKSPKDCVFDLEEK